MKILKFGGSSVATAEAIRATVSVVRAAYEVQTQTGVVVVVVVSALGGVTDALLRAAQASADRVDGHRDHLDSLRRRHLETVADLDLGAGAAELRTELETLLSELGDLLQGVSLLREASPRALDRILSYGERLSSRIVAATLARRGVPALAVDATDLIVTDDRFGAAQVDVDRSYRRIAEVMSPHVDAERVPVVTGFLAATPDGETTTLGRGGSDYTAALLGAALDASAIELWTDVSGVMSADPRQVAGATPIDRLSFAELMELSHFGAKVVYPPSIRPARTGAIPLIIRNTFSPNAPGTTVVETIPGAEAARSETPPIRGVSSIGSVALLRLEGDGMIAVPGIAGRLFGALARSEINVVLISQASSEHSICFAVEPSEAEPAENAVAAEFELERAVGQIDDVIIETDLSLLAVVGEGMRERHGIAGRLFGVLGEHCINIRAVTQGSSELNITMAVDADNETKALNVIHSAFFDGPDGPGETDRTAEIGGAGSEGSALRLSRRLHVALAGVGAVGSALLDQIRTAGDEIRSRRGIDLRVAALWNSKRMLLGSADDPEADRPGIDLDRWNTDLASGEPLDSAAVLDDLSGLLRDGVVLVDCTAAEGVDELYGSALGRGISVVAANKKAFGGALAVFEDITNAASGQAIRAADVPTPSLFYEATVGAGLPVLSTLETLLGTGDRVEQIDGVLSGTLNFVLDLVDGGVAFSEAVRQAYDLGLTEPNPADDLSGADVARKVLILGRTAGWRTPRSAIDIESLLTGPEWANLPIEEFWHCLPRVDVDFERRRSEAAENGKRLRYVATLANGRGRIGIQAVAEDHPCYSVLGPDNLVAFTTSRYRQRPLVVSGPGAGVEVTAAGVLGDILRVAERGC